MVTSDLELEVIQDSQGNTNMFRYLIAALVIGSAVACRAGSETPESVVAASPAPAQVGV